MNRRFFHLLAAIGIISVLITPVVLAKKAKSKSPGPIVLTSIDPGGKSITVTDKQGKDPSTYTVTSLTKITLNGQPARLSDLSKGMTVDIELGGGGNVADKIDATSAHPDSSKNKTT
jgi:hypothetical protein